MISTISSPLILTETGVYNSMTAFTFGSFSLPLKIIDHQNLFIMLIFHNPLRNLIREHT
jgi:hypothetical protein